MKHLETDVVVVGGGHAGAEAAHAAARVGVQVALVTLTAAGIGVMSCNPAIGGLGKGHLVREIDAMDGVMGRVADRAGIQFRLLNRRKGPAVQGPRAQADRAIYCAEMQKEILGHPNIAVVENEVVDLVVERGVVSGVILNDGSKILSKAVVLTTGTFLRGVIHIGDVSRPGGRIGDAPSIRLADRIRDFGLPLGRLKTGTPPRLKKETINWDVLEEQPGDDDPVLFSFLSTQPFAQQVSCGITHTNEKTHDIIRENLHRSAMYGGQIEGVGPRYCPSIEDKIVRFAEKPSHQIFLEPESLSSDLIYPNGISTSLPEEVQEEYVRSIKGLEHAVIVQPGYAIEYDYVDPTSLSSRLEVIAAPGLYLAGQINGTTGYEEAAAQGLVAGLNAAKASLDEEPVRFGRESSYIGVMIDDLVTRGVTEPYRMFTSRAEYRLSLRADNADQRLTPLGIAVGCVGAERAKMFGGKVDKIDHARGMLEAMSVTSKVAAEVGINVADDGKRRDGVTLLSLADVQFDDLVSLEPLLDRIDLATRRQVKNDALYAQYIERQKKDVEGLMRDEGYAIPANFEYSAVGGLSNEQRSKLERSRPETLAQAGRIEGVTPAALTLILAKLRRTRKQSA